MTVTCPECGIDHDVRACAEEGASCSCCAALFASHIERVAALGGRS